MAYEHILLDVSPEGTAVLTLNRPAKRNAFNAEVISELSDLRHTCEKPGLAINIVGITIITAACYLLTPLIFS